MKNQHEIKDFVRAEYGQAARDARNGKPYCSGTGNLLERDKQESGMGGIPATVIELNHFHEITEEVEASIPRRPWLNADQIRCYYSVRKRDKMARNATKSDKENGMVERVNRQ